MVRIQESDIQPGVLLQDGREGLLKVSTVYPDDGIFTAQVVMPVPPRTIVITVTRDDALNRLSRCSDGMYARYQEAYDRG